MIMINKNELRAQRLLSQMDGKRCKLLPTDNSDLMLVHIEGIRTVKCPPQVIANMVSLGSVKLSGDRLEVTPAGRASLRRHAAAMQPFRAQHDAVVLKRVEPSQAVDVETNAVWVTDESPLSRLGKLKAACGRPYLTRLEFEAGERLRRDFEAGMMQPRVSASLDPTRVASGRSTNRNNVADLTDTAIGARERVSRALDRLEPELAGIAVDICCFLKGFETVENERGWPRRSAKLMLKTALGGLSRHYFPMAKAKSGSGTIQHWGADQYRPALR